MDGSTSSETGPHRFKVNLKKPVSWLFVPRGPQSRQGGHSDRSHHDGRGHDRDLQGGRDRDHDRDPWNDTGPGAVAGRTRGGARAIHPEAALMQRSGMVRRGAKGHMARFPELG